MWPVKVKDRALVASGRHCCVCRGFCGRNIELHHIVMEAKGGLSSFENCIPLCFVCHAEAGHYNSSHPKGTKYSPTELTKHRDTWYKVRARLDYDWSSYASEKGKTVKEVYEGQEVTLKGFVWREAFAGPPNYESFETDRVEIYWMLVLPEPVTFYYNCFETEKTLRQDDVKKLQLCVRPDFYSSNKDIVRSDVELTGTLYPSTTGHHNGDANFIVK
ncbi:HNH endonuclease [Pseudomonas syringae group genomosp. 3]|uniref:HNH endonuclease n=1 Tax=Pseudomonas syringae group genomosp. 3 TaxID=251701 RepID=UPI000EFE7CA1|nr:HNH endonuclease [Pseudomonas syringae group genomosp. 3]